MLFLLRYAPSKFHPTMDAALSVVKWQFALVYYHDILLLTCSAAYVVTLSCDAGAALKLKK